jgi:predicted Zn-dependent peptidase
MVQEVFRQAIQAGTLVVVLAGKFEPGEANAALSARLVALPEAPRRGVSRYDNPPLPIGRRQDGFASYELRGKAILGSDPQFSAVVLAATGLGTGKESTVFRVLRQGLGLSYQQAAALIPSQGGWVPRLMLIQTRPEESAGLPAKVREAVLKDINAWDEESLARMKAMLRAAMEQGLPDAPLWLGEEGPPSPTLEGRSALAALMASLGGDPRGAESLAGRAQDLGLEAVKAAARSWVESGAEILLP